MTGVLTPWTIEGFFLFRYYQRPTDAWAINIMGVYTLHEAISVQARKGVKQRVPVSLSFPLFEPDSPLFEPMVLFEGSTISLNTLLENHSILCISRSEWPVAWLPEPVAILIQHGRWNQLLMLCRYYREGMPIPHPVPEWISERQADLLQNIGNVDVPFHAGVAAVLAQYVRKSCKRVLDGMPKADADALRFQLEGAVAALDSVQGAKTFADTHGQRSRAATIQKAQQTLSVLLALRLARSCESSATEAMLDHSIEATVPIVLRTAVKQTRFDLPSGSTVSRQMLSLDAAIAAMRAKDIESETGPLFLYCDSSVQAKSDWMMSTLESINELPRVYMLASGLSRTIEDYKRAFQDGVENPHSEAVWLRKLGIIQFRCEAASELNNLIQKFPMIPQDVTGGAKLEGKVRSIASSIM